MFYKREPEEILDFPAENLCLFQLAFGLTWWRQGDLESPSQLIQLTIILRNYRHGALTSHLKFRKLPNLKTDIMDIKSWNLVLKDKASLKRDALKLQYIIWIQMGNIQAKKKSVYKYTI